MLKNLNVLVQLNLSWSNKNSPNGLKSDNEQLKKVKNFYMNGSFINESSQIYPNSPSVKEIDEVFGSLENV